MKNLILVLALAGFMNVTHLYSQSKTYELGLRLEGTEGFQDFDFVYKQSLKEENKFVRYRLVVFNIGSFTDVTLGNTELSLGVGWEKRKTLSSKFQFAHGFDLGFDIALLIEEESGIGLQIGYMIGVQYRISEEFCIGLETIPNFSVLFGESISYNFTMEFDNPKALALTFVYVLRNAK